MVSAARGANTPFARDFRPERTATVAVRRPSLSTSIALAAAGLVIALGIAQAAITSSGSADLSGLDATTASAYVAGPSR